MKHYSISIPNNDTCTTRAIEEVVGLTGDLQSVIRHSVYTIYGIVCDDDTEFATMMIRVGEQKVSNSKMDQ